MKEELRDIAQQLDVEIGYCNGASGDTTTKAIDALRDAASRLESLEQEMQEQARIIGMGAERELALIAKVELMEKDVARWRFIRDSDQSELGEGTYKYKPYITDYSPNDYYAPHNIAGDAADEVVDTAMQANNGE